MCLYSVLPLFSWLLLVQSGAVSAAPNSLAPWAGAQKRWLNPAANSEQRQPLYLGRAPRELEFQSSARRRADISLSEELKELAQLQLQALLPGFKGTVEAWLARNDDGLRTWVIARTRVSSEQWQWVSEERSIKRLATSHLDPLPLYPRWLDPNDPDKKKEIFNAFDQFDSLYAKPVFGNCLWVDRTTKQVTRGWHAPEARERFGRTLSPKEVCVELPMPMVWEGVVETLFLEWDGKAIAWPEHVRFEKTPPVEVSAVAASVPLVAIPEGTMDRYREAVRVFAGEKKAETVSGVNSPIFARKSSAQPNHQLHEVNRYLAAKYSSLGWGVRWDRFSWNGISQSNLVARIPGKLPPSKNRPIVLADHIDTAMSEDVFDATGKRVACPGADDNATATAALLIAAELLKPLPLNHDVWLLHLTGEEFPADDLGARRVVGEWLKTKTPVGAVLLMDMIGYRTNAGSAFQINAGESLESLWVARQALGVAAKTAPKLTPLLRTRWDLKSYLYNTDGLMFSDAGFPVVLFNEHLNRLEHLDRPHYHQSTDTTQTVDFDYAWAIAKTAIELAAQLAMAP
jgi:hypothetical protein